MLKLSNEEGFFYPFKRMMKCLGNPPRVLVPLRVTRGNRWSEGTLAVMEGHVAN